MNLLKNKKVVIVQRQQTYGGTRDKFISWEPIKTFSIF